ncbi:MAG: heavy metal-binding domain-containing protein, partial [Candidatus Latescibacterota bacterium]
MKSEHNAERNHDGHPSDGALRDPVCGMEVREDSPHKTSHNDKTYYFCCAGCLSKFEAEPDRYLDGSADAKEPMPEGTLYTCPMHPEVEQSGSGDCPKCGMALELMGVPASTTRTEWTCPMHPEIVRDEPGDCPKCGMALEPRTVATEEEDNPELRDMSRRFWFSVALAIPLLAIAMIDMLPGH